jgi:hypothetical protein
VERVTEDQVVVAAGQLDQLVVTRMAAGMIKREGRPRPVDLPPRKADGRLEMLLMKGVSLSLMAKVVSRL